MAILVQKFGGTSVGSLERINAIADKIAHTKTSDKDLGLVVVVSAMSRETDRLLGMAEAISKHPNQRELDVLLSTGEQVSVALLSIALHARGIKAISYTGWQVPIVTDAMHTKARIIDIDQQRILKMLDEGFVVVVAGFQGADAEGNITTLGRGGSDTTAVALAAVLEAQECQIFTDVEGVYTADPRIVTNAKLLQEISSNEMLELAGLGAKVMQSAACEFVQKYAVPTRVLSSFVEGKGTKIKSSTNHHNSVCGVAYSKQEAYIGIVGLTDKAHNSHRLLALILAANIEIDMLVQNVNIGAEDKVDMAFTMPRKDYELALKLVEEYVVGLPVGRIVGDACVAKLSLVGVGLRSNAGITNNMFKVLGDADINIKLIAASETKVSVVIDEKFLELGIQALHDGFQLATEPKEVVF